MKKELSKVKGRTHDFYTCYKCNRLITALEEHLFLTEQLDRTGLCTCGAMSYSPSNPPGPFKKLVWNLWVWPFVSPLFLVFYGRYTFLQGWLRVIKIATKGRRGF